MSLLRTRPYWMLALPLALMACQGTTSSTTAAPFGVMPTQAASVDDAIKSAAETYAVIKGEKAEVPVIPMGDPAMIAKILDEGKNRNKVMDHLTHLTQEIGPRLTGSERLERANRWAQDQFQSWGLESSLFKWGEIPVRFDRGPSSGKLGVMQGEEDDREFRGQRDVEFTALAWSAGTNGPVLGRIVKMPANEAELEEVKDSIKGAWILTPATAPGGRRGVTNSMSARQAAFMEIRQKWAGGDAKVVEEKQPETKADAPATGIAGNWEGTAKGGPVPEGVPFTMDLNLGADNAVTGTFGYPGYQSGPVKEGKFDPEAKKLTFNWDGPGGTSKFEFTLDGDALKGESARERGNITLAGKRQDPAKAAQATASAATMEEKVLTLGPAGWISSSGDDRVRTTSLRGWRELSPDQLPQDVEVQVRRADYDWMNSRIADGNEIFAQFDLKHSFTSGPIPVYNTVAEIKGSVWPDEVVIVSAHLDSWDGPGSQGTTDNGTGSSVTLEAARILAAAKAKPKRTIRFVLWSGEEQGLLGSREYVKHLKETGELDKISAVFVDDGGTNYEGGLNCTNEMAPMLAAATAPVNGQFYSEVDKKHLDVNVQPSGDLGRSVSGGSSDHASFLREGIPAFFWEEVGRADYFYGWHTQHDKIDLAIPEYLQQSATCAAITAYNLACAPEKLPRPPKPEPRPEGERRRPREGAPQAGAASNENAPARN